MSFKIIMTTSVTRPCFTTQHQICKIGTGAAWSLLSVAMPSDTRGRESAPAGNIGTNGPMGAAAAPAEHGCERTIAPGCGAGCVTVCITKTKTDV